MVDIDKMRAVLAGKHGKDPLTVSVDWVATVLAELEAGRARREDNRAALDRLALS